MDSSSETAKDESTRTTLHVENELNGDGSAEVAFGFQRLCDRVEELSDDEPDISDTTCYEKFSGLSDTIPLLRESGDIRTSKYFLTWYGIRSGSVNARNALKLPREVYARYYIAPGGSNPWGM